MELKFRVWNGTEMVYDVMVGKFGTFYINPDNNGLDKEDTASLTPFNTKYEDDIDVMQYIGVKADNGDDIYVGDIVEVGYDNSDTSYIALIKDIRRLPDEMFGSSVESRKVIGNVYEPIEKLEEEIFNAIRNQYLIMVKNYKVKVIHDDNEIF